VLALIVGGGGTMAAVGVLVGSALGLGAALLLARVFEIGNIGPVPFISAAAIVVVVTLAASAVPAWRAWLLSPAVTRRD
jgi:hypothetical protein